MNPGPGTYRLTSTPSGAPPTSYSMTMRIDGAGVGHVTFGELLWDPAEDWFRHPKANVVVRFLSAYVAGPPEVLGTFVAIVKAGQPDEQTYSGTYRPA